MTVPIRHAFLLSAIFLLVGFALYGNVVLQGGFVFDDYPYIVENRALDDIVFSCNLAETRYVAYLTFALQRSLSGADPFAYHLVNVLLHVANALLLYLLVSLLIRLAKAGDDAGGLLGPWGIPFLTALLFLVHPLATQSVSYITQRFTSLAAFFYLLATVLYLEARARVENGPLRRRSAFWLLAGSVLAALLGMKTKEICFTLPFLLAILDNAFVPRSPSGRPRILYLAPFFLAAAIVPLSLYGPEWGLLPNSPAGMSEEMRGEKLFDLEARSSSEYLLTQFRVLVIYLRLLLVPHPLRAVYDLKASTTFFSLPVVLSFALLAALFTSGCSLLIRSRRQGAKEPVLLALAGTGILWFFVTSAVESSIIPIKDLIFEHRTYLPSAGAFLAVSSLLCLFLRSRSPERALRQALVLFIGASVILGAATFQRNRVWADEIRFWDEAVEGAPQRPIVWNNRAMALFRRGAYADALRDMNISVEHAEKVMPLGVSFDNPDISKVMMASTYENRALVHEALGNFAAAAADRSRAATVMMTGSIGDYGAGPHSARPRTGQD